MAARFDPEGKGYDYESAKALNVGRDANNHWYSRDPKSGLLLKGRSHPTFSKTMEAERQAGMKIRRKKDGRYYSLPQHEWDAMEK